MIAAIMLLGTAVQTPRAEAQISFSAFLKDCERKTIVLGKDEKGKSIKVGERLSGYCQGILEGIFAVLVRAKSICVKEESPTPEFMLSTVLTYRTETKLQDNDAESVIEAAFKRAFRCEN
jgi:hypothetical protein